MSINRWRPHEWKKARLLLEQGNSAEFVGQMLGRTAAHVRDKIRWEKMTADKRAERREKINAGRKKRGSEARVHFENPRAIEKAPEHLFEERARRLSAPRTIGQQVFGDPPPGFSALDRKRQGLSV